MDVAFYVEGASAATVKGALKGSRTWPMDESRRIKAHYGNAGRGKQWVWVDSIHADEVQSRLTGIHHTLVLRSNHDDAGYQTISKPRQYRTMEVLGRNLKPGDEVHVSEDLTVRKFGRVRVVDVTKRKRFGRNEWVIRHSGPCAGILTNHLWTGAHWSEMTADHDTKYTISRPV